MVQGVQPLLCSRGTVRHRSPYLPVHTLEAEHPIGAFSHLPLQHIPQLLIDPQSPHPQQTPPPLAASADTDSEADDDGDEDESDSDEGSRPLRAARAPLLLTLPRRPRSPSPAECDGEGDNGEEDVDFSNVCTFDLDDSDEEERAPKRARTERLVGVAAEPAAPPRQPPQSLVTENELRRAECLASVEERGDRTYTMHVTSALAFMEFYCPELSTYNFLAGNHRMFPVSQEDSRELGVEHTAAGNKTGVGKHRIDNRYTLSPAGRELVALGKLNRQVFRLLLHCAGGSGGSGANCRKNPGAKGQWCAAAAGDGSCAPGCTWRRGANHHCAVEVRVTATIAQVLKHTVQLQITGRHTADRVVPVPVDLQKLDLSLIFDDYIRNTCQAGAVCRSKAIRDALALVPQGARLTGRCHLGRIHYSNVVSYAARLTCSAVPGTFTAFDAVVRQHALSMATPLPNGVIALYYRAESGEKMQLVLSSEKALDALRDKSVQFVLSDTNWKAAPQKPAFSVIGCPVPLPVGGFRPLVASISNTEDCDSTFFMAEALQLAVPCCATCDHEWKEGWTDGTYSRWRSCAKDSVTPFRPTVGIDKSSTAQAGFRRAGWSISVCFFHSIKAMLKNLKEKLGSKKHWLIPFFDDAIRMVMRAQTAEVYKRALDALLATVESWGTRGYLGADPADFISYLKTAMGFEGTLWEGTQGDFRARDVEGLENTTNKVESHFLSVQKTIFYCNLNGTYARLAPLFLGVRADGEGTPVSYFDTFERAMAARAKEGKGRVKSVELQRLVNGRWLHATGKVQRRRHTGGHVGTRWYLVNKEVPNVAKSPLPAAVASGDGDGDGGGTAETLPDSFNVDTELNDILYEVETAGIKAEDGHYVVGIVSEPGRSDVITCICPDFWRRGGTHSLCKHAVAAVAYEEEHAATGAAAKRRVVELQRKHIMDYFMITERNKPRAATDHELYDACRAGEWARVRAILEEGPRPRRSLGDRDDATTIATRYTLTLAAGVWCNVGFERVCDKVRAELDLPAATYVVRNGYAAQYEWTPKIRPKRDLCAGDIVFSVSTAADEVLIVDDASARDAQLLVADASAERELVVLPYVVCRGTDVGVCGMDDFRRPQLSKLAKNDGNRRPARR
ncbi:hypothetical protein JKP88DRAFT_268578 [Tribonema minus]|uniref:SWIM-type domain-containing protein n=1 Tax=Tribonema minus TaxID=303371 RepID=A0A835YZE7_9STRA|nr:hypothetical protein JKP88DRAFT_268578 [Tribonema minus]